MTWSQIATEVAPIVQSVAALFGVVGLFLVWRQVKVAARQLELSREQINLTVEQMRQQNRWNKINTQHMLLSALPSTEAEREMWRIVEKYKDGESWTLPSEACSKLYDDIDAWLIVKNFVNCHERLCAAISANSLADDYAYSVHGAKIIDTHRIFQHYIDYTRKRKGNATIFLELEKVATRWAVRAQKEQDSIERELAQLRARTGTQEFIN